MFQDWERHRLIPSDHQRILSLGEMLCVHHGVVPRLFLQDLQGLLVLWVRERVPLLVQQAAQ